MLLPFGGNFFNARSDPLKISDFWKKEKKLFLKIETKVRKFIATILSPRTLTYLFRVGEEEMRDEIESWSWKLEQEGCKGSMVVGLLALTCIKELGVYVVGKD